MTALIKIKTIALLLLPLMLTCLALLPSAQAFVTDPDETFPNFNTAAGFEALLANTAAGGTSNTAYGIRALKANTTGGSNLAIGGFALINNIDGNMNTAIGNNAMFSNQHGSSNMALGQGALRVNTDGDNNVAMGAQALANNKADGNVGVGFQALFSNTTGSGNTATGFRALFSNTATGLANTATGFQALFSNTTGGDNTANGLNALFSNTTGNLNTANGVAALYSNSIGDSNTANGFFALQDNTTGAFNTADGVVALGSNTTGSRNTALGQGALTLNTTGNNNTALGLLAGSNLTTGSNNIDIGWNVVGVTGESATIRIGSGQTRTFIAGIRGRTTANANAVPVLIDSAGQLGTASSSRRFKKEIEPMDKTSEAILALKPVTFHYKGDSTGTPQFGLIAEDVAKVNPDLIVHNENGEIYTVRYDVVNAMLLNEFLKEHQTVQKQQKEIDALKAELKEQRALIQAVNDKVELSKSAPQTVLNNQ